MTNLLKRARAQEGKVFGSDDNLSMLIQTENQSDKLHTIIGAGEWLHTYYLS